MNNYFKVTVRYIQHGEAYEVEHFMETPANINEAMKIYSQVIAKAYLKAFEVTHAQFISAEPTQVSEIEYKRQALSPSGKRDLNMRKAGY
ncbi:hypothetical protein COE91_02730 [Bacillus toyonensis]|nr:hypothetical protein COE91_02730 [Bacillus toyonensis]